VRNLTVGQVSGLEGGNPSCLLMQAHCCSHIPTIWINSFLSSQRRATAAVVFEVVTVMPARMRSINKHKVTGVILNCSQFSEFEKLISWDQEKI